MNKGKKLTMDDLEAINFPYYYNLVKEGKMKRKEVEGLLFNGNDRRYGRYKNVMEGKPARYRERVLSKALRFYDGNNNLISKQCTTCGQVKDINEFSKNKKILMVICVNVKNVLVKNHLNVNIGNMRMTQIIIKRRMINIGIKLMKELEIGI